MGNRGVLADPVAEIEHVRPPGERFEHRERAPLQQFAPRFEQQRIEAIRKRIEARRAQIRAQQNNAGASSSASNEQP